MLPVKIVNTSPFELPHYATPQSAGMDLRANTTETITLKPLQRTLVPTGLFIELPEGYEAQVRPRSGLAIKSGLTVLNSPGTIDSDYRGELEIILINLGADNVVIKDGQRIAQLVTAPVSRAVLAEAQTLAETSRGSGGFGSTGVN